MTWQPEVDELHERTRLAHLMGGEERVARQKAAGKLTIRERVDAMCDDGTFHEVGGLAGVARYDDDNKLVAFTPSNLVAGVAEIDGRPVVISGDDFTVRGGSAEATIPAKRNFAERLAVELGLPHIRLVDGMGGGGSVKSIEIDGRTHIPGVKGWENVVEHLAVAPSIALALGSVAGIGAARVVSSHYSMIVRETAQMMIAGPALVEQAGQPEVTKEELGHARVHTSNGAIDDAVDSEEEAFERTRRFLSYLPRNVDELPARGPRTDDPERREEKLISIVPREQRRVFKMREVIEAVVDLGSFFEMGKGWGRSIITGFCRLDGWPVALFAEDPYVYGGAWTADASQKIVRFLDLAGMFHLPVVHLTDCPGFLIGKDAEETATIRHGSRALAALGQCPTPFMSVVVRKAFGVAGAAQTKPGSTHFRFSWPSGDWGSLPIEGGIEVAYRAELAGVEDPAGEIAKIKARLNGFRSPFRSTDNFEVEEVIDPRDTRPILCRWADLVAPARKAGPVSYSYRP